MADIVPTGLPKFCDNVFACLVTNEHAQVAVTYWAYSPFYGIPLVLLDWLYVPFVPSVWDRVETELDQYACVCGARLGSMGLFIEGPSLAGIAQQRGINVRAIPDHITEDKAWLDVSLAASHQIRGGFVKVSAAAVQHVQEAEQEKNRGSNVLTFGALQMSGGPRTDDASVPSFIFGVVVALDETLSRPLKKRPAEVRIVR